MLAGWGWREPDRARLAGGDRGRLHAGAGMLAGARDTSRPGGGGDHVVVDVVQRCAHHHGDDLQHDAPARADDAEDARRLLEQQGVDPAELSREIGERMRQRFGPAPR